MKTLRKIKSHAKKIFAYLSLFSMFANTLAPFAAILPAYVYAEDTGAPVDEIVVENKEESAPEEEADTEETADGQDLAVEEGTNENEITDEEEVIDPEAPDILKDGVMDVNLVDEIEEVVEVEEIPTPVEEPIIEDPIVDEPIVIAEDSAPSENIEPEAPVVEEPVEEVKEYEYLEDGVEIKDSVDEDWDVEDEKAETVDNVKLGVKYIFPLDEEVTLTFTRLPKDEELRSHLKIERVKVEDLDLPDDFVTDAEYAFDITTDMEDGDFEFDLTLPKPEGSEAEVSYIEKSIDEAKEELKNEDIKKVEEDKLEQDEEDDNVKVKDLDHFTIYIITYSDPSFSVEENTYARGETVYAKAGDLSISKFYKIRLNPDGHRDEAVYSPCFDPASSSDVLTFSYLIPGTARLGDWKAVLRVHDNSGCTDNDDRVVTDYFTVTTAPPASNPPLPIEACGLDIALVLDVSGSINATELAQMKSAFVAFVDALSGTPTQFSVIKFDTTANILQTFTSDYTAVKAAINSASGGGYTNWEDGLEKAWSTYDPRKDKPNLMIFSSDGNPNRVGAGSSASESDAVATATVVANTIKTAGTRILALGIGSDLDENNMIAISGTNVDTGNILTSDVITSDFADLAKDLGELANKTCGGTITVKKYIDTTDTPGGSGWEYAVSGTTSKNLTTGTDGTDNTGKIPAGTYSIVETNMLTGYSFGSAICKDQSGATVGSSITDGWGSIALDDEDIISCEFINTTNPLTGTIVVHKSVVGPHDEDIYDTQTYSVKLDDGTPQTIGNDGEVTFNDVVAGEHTIIETSLPTGSELISITPDSDSGTTGAQVTLAAEETLHVNVTNRKNLPSIYGHKYNDVNANGVYDLGTDQPLSGWTIFIDANENGDLDSGELSTTTNAQGEYSFLDLSSGLNVVCEEVETGWTQSYPTDNNGCHRVTLGVLGAGNAVAEDVDFLNYETPSLTVIKEVINDHGGTATIGDFEIKIGNDLINFGAGVVNGSTTTYTSTPSVLPGISYTLSEKDVTGYIEGNWGCKNATGAVVAHNPLILSPGQDITCTIVNNDQSGSIIVKKDVVPNDSTVWDFEITTNMSGAGGPYPINNLSDGSTYGVHSLMAGLYTITETADSNYTTTISCDDGTTAAGNSINVDVGLGEELECIFTNTIKQGKIIVEKQVLPNGHGQTFNFTGEVNGMIGDEGTLEKDVNPGTYTVSESPFSTSGHQLKSIVCDDGQSTNPSTGNIQTGVATFNVEPGETVRCVFTNEMFGSITVHKYHDLNQDKDQDADEPYLQDWEMSLYSGNDCIEGNYMSKQNTDSDGNAVFYSIVPGQSYSIKETLEDGWTNVTDICQNFTVTPGEAKQIDFGNIQYGKISGYKYNDLDGNGVWDDGEPGLNNWTINASTLQGSTSTTTDVNGYYEFELLPETYRVTEDNKTGWVQTEPLNQDSNSCVLNLGAGDQEQCNFGNQAEYASISVSKIDDSDPVSLGDIITYTINWSLSSNVPVNDVKISELFVTSPTSELIDDLWVSTNNPFWSYDSPYYYTYDLGDFPAGEHSGSLEIKLKVVDTKPSGVNLPNNIENFIDIVGTKSTGGQINNSYTERTQVRAPVTIKATKIVCDSEKDLPDWGEGEPVNIDENTASNWLSSHPDCYLEQDWKFQWGDDEDANPSDTYLGEATGWTTFGPTDASGQAIAIINNFGDTVHIKVREALQEGYIPFTYITNGSTNNDSVSAEIYCHTDVLNYDNDDRINNPQYGETYYCVAWNALKKGDLEVTKTVDWTGITPDSNQTFEICIQGPSYPQGDCKISDYDGEKLVWDNLLLGDYTIVETDPGFMWSITGSGSQVNVGFGTTATHTVGNSYVPYCGDGVKNQETEQCDGLDGITEDLNFCTPTCKLIPIYDGGHSCAPGTTPVKVGEYTVDSTDSDGITFGVNSGQEYLFKVLGTYNYDINNSGKYADGAYGTSNNWITTRDDIGIWGTNMGVISLLGDLGGGIGVIEWDDDETFNSSHIYQKVYTPDADNIQFLISDWYDGWYSNSCDSQSCMRDNSGNLKLEVYECQEFGSIQGRKYYDVNGNGDFDQSEKDEAGDPNRLDNWTIEIYDDSWNLVDSMLTGDDNTSAGNVLKGQYRFVNVIPGTYYVCEVLPNGWYQTEPASGEEHEGAYCHMVTVNPGDAVTEIQFGNYQGSDVTVCKLDAEKNYLPGWKVILRSTGLLENVVVNPDGGTYSSSDLVEGDYALISYGTYEYRGSTGLLTDPAYSERLASDGYTGPYFPWINVMDLGTPGALGIMINGSPTNWGDYLSADHRYALGFLYHEGAFNFSVDDNVYGDNVGSMNVDIYNGYVGVTEEDGCYTFENVPFGTYRLDEIMLDGWRNVSGLDEVTIDESIESFEIINELETYDIHGYKWSDLNGDGVYDSEEPLLSGWRVFIDENDNNIWDGEEQFMFTDDTVEHYGWYWFEDLLPGQYKICEELPVDWVQTYPGTIDSSQCHVVDLPEGASSEWTLNMVEGPEYNFGNLQKGEIKVYKFNDLDGDGEWDDGEPLLPNWEINISKVDDGNYSQMTGTEGSTVFSLLPDSYILGETIQDGWEQTGIYCDDMGEGVLITGPQEAYGHHGQCEGWNGCGNAETCALWACEVNGYSSLVSYGESKPCTEFEALGGKCHLFWNRGNVQWNWSQSYGGGCPVMGVTDIYCSNGYGIVQRIADLNLAQDVYHDEVYNLRVNPGDVRSCYIGNVENSELRISETNDSWPNTLEIGDTFTYTIEVRAVGGPVNDVVMINLPPQGFEPVPITFSAVSTDAGHVIDTSGVVYASPGTWDLGNLDEDEVVTITYEAKVTEDVDSGIYPDVSFAQGEGMGGTGLLALSEESGFPINDGVVDENFVGTQVKIAVELELNDEVDVKEEEEGEVLGASTELPATGASTFWVNLVLVLGSIGGLLLLIGGLGTMKKAKKLFMILFAIAGLSYVLNVKANAFSLPQPVVRISEPKSPVGENFNVTFVVLSTDSGQSMTAKCMAINPGSSTPYQFGSDINVTPGGSSYNCEVGDSVLDDSGTYKFYVLVDPDSADDVKSDTVEVYYDGIGPDKPKYIEKEKVNDCVNKITLRTADDGETSSVRVYADDDKEIDIDDSHKIETESIGPNEKFDFEHIVSGDSCDKTWYYAVVAFDDAGNASKPRSEVITTTTTTTEEEEEETGAIPVEGGAGLTEGGEGATGPEGTEGEGLEVTFGEGEEGSVLGEETGGEESGKGLFKSPWFWIAAAGLGIVIISATKKKKA